MPRQATIRRVVEAVGVSGVRRIRSRVCFRPAPAGNGVAFRRTDIGSCVAVSLESAWCPGGSLVLGRSPRQVEGVEQLLAVVVALGLTDLFIELDGPEPPFFDGSARTYFDLVHEAGLCVGPGIVPPLQVRVPLRVEGERGWLELRPSSCLRLDVRGGQSGDARADQVIRFEVSPRAAAAHVGGAEAWPCPAVGSRRAFRTLDSERLRHGALELLGCLALLGRPVQAEIAASQPNPALAVTGLRALLATETAVGW